MPRGGSNKLPAATKALRGTLKKHRETKAAHAPAPCVVGPAPTNLSAREKVVWAELATQVQGVFTVSDRTAFTLLVRQMARLDSPESDALPPHVYCTLVKTVAGLLAQFGCTPASRGRVDPAPQKSPTEDEEDIFLFGTSCSHRGCSGRTYTPRGVCSVHARAPSDPAH